QVISQASTPCSPPQPSTSRGAWTAGPPAGASPGLDPGISTQGCAGAGLRFRVIDFLAGTKIMFSFISKKERQNL
ncbi:MAG: hypothetical protein ABSH17_06040, partial [Syntrophobacteraceae bacterium]